MKSLREFSLALAVVLSLSIAVRPASAAESIAPCRIEVVDAENGWPVPLVELRTTHDVWFRHRQRRRRSRSICRS